LDPSIDAAAAYVSQAPRTTCFATHPLMRPLGPAASGRNDGDTGRAKAAPIVHVMDACSRSGPTAR